jgi:hypothetical protein
MIKVEVLEQKFAKKNLGYQFIHTLFKFMHANSEYVQKLKVNISFCKPTYPPAPTPPPKKKEKKRNILQETPVKKRKSLVI